MRAARTFQPGFECAEALAMMGLWLWQHHLGMYARLLRDQLGEHCSV